MLKVGFFILKAYPYQHFNYINSLLYSLITHKQIMDFNSNQR